MSNFPFDGSLFFVVLFYYGNALIFKGRVVSNFILQALQNEPITVSISYFIPLCINLQLKEVEEKTGISQE